MVYIAKLHFDNKGSQIAIKRASSRASGQGEQRFFSEIEMHATHNHPNVVSLLGYCDDHDEMILLFEHASNNSLDDYLKSIDNTNNLTWTQRLQMCLDIAKGLNHIHTKMDRQQHGDIRSANILLGKNGEAKIAYYGISNLHPANQEVDTKVYRDPEYEKAGKLEKESDIYSLGVVMFEIFFGRLAYDLVYIGENEKGLAHIARRCFNDRTITEMIDPKLIEENIVEDIFTSIKRPNQDSLGTIS
ncbi:putative receptor-like protein kinase At2g23200 [Bidens hawaiensis]|uniref:putative receptor-like protein kinase At2g23200 n=1 Tax=Bidens hawaiensis TaxID=980011 RepID=UPI00404B30C4